MRTLKKTWIDYGFLINFIALLAVITALGSI